MIGHADFMLKESEDVALGVNSIADICLARVNKEAFPKLHSFRLKNKGSGNVTFTLKKRGVSTTIAAESLNGLQVGGSDRFRGPMANRRVTPQTVVIVDTNAGVPQRVEDTNGDGILWQTDGPATITYPRQVGTINYNDAVIDFTFGVAVTLNVTAGYQHTDWSAFGTPITFGLVAGGAERTFLIVPDNAENFFDSVKDEDEIGFFGKKTAVDQAETVLSLVLCYFGDDSDIKLPIKKGEIDDYPYHNA